jgi:hypothetical protein
MAARAFDFLGNSTYFKVGRGLYTNPLNTYAPKIVKATLEVCQV